MPKFQLLFALRHLIDHLTFQLERSYVRLQWMQVSD
jgi:hypothetical protein